jgi:hypothetical protein
MSRALKVREALQTAKRKKDHISDQAIDRALAILLNSDTRSVKTLSQDQRTESILQIATKIQTE